MSRVWGFFCRIPKLSFLEMVSVLLLPKIKSLSLPRALQIWREYDTDNSGYIEADELKVR